MNAYAIYQEAVRSAKISEELKNAPIVGYLSGSAVVIESIVRKASENSGIAMDWNYSGGVAYIHSNGDIKKARSALYWAIPKGDLSEMDT